MSSSETLPLRSAVAREHTWDLEALFPSVQAWRDEFQALKGELSVLATYRGRLGESSQTLVRALTHYLELLRRAENLSTYASQRSDEDKTNSENLGLLDQSTSLWTELSGVGSFITPELLLIDSAQLKEWLREPALGPYRRMIDEIVRFRPHTLSKEEEQLLAMAGEVFQIAGSVFSQLNNADLTFGKVAVEGQEREISHGNFSLLLQDSNRDLRREVYEKYYAAFDSHKNTIAATLAGSVKQDIYLARVKKYPSARDMALFQENVTAAVYDTLVETVRKNSRALHRYYQVRKKALRLSTARMYDTYVPVVADVKPRHTYEQAAQLILDACAPLGAEYCAVLKEGFFSRRWVDVFENKGKRSGAYSGGSYDSPPYMLMNFREDLLDSVFTLAHEAGHSMHSYFSRKHQTFQDSAYGIFVAEVASTLNEQLLLHHLRKKYAHDKPMLLYLVNSQVDDIKSTLHRQTMFAEFERDVHLAAERGDPLTVETFKGMYRPLLEAYFGGGVEISEIDALECLRIPHFYSAFYVYKYATGISAAISLSRGILSGKSGAAERYLAFLAAGCSKYPLQLLKDAGVDLTTPRPIEEALELFEQLVGELEAGIGG